MLFDIDSGSDNGVDLGDCRTCVWTPGVVASMYIPMWSNPTNNKKWTFFCGLRRAKLGTATSLFGVSTTTADVLAGNIGFDSTDHLIFSTDKGYWNLVTSRVFVDTSAWTYLQVNYDSSQAVASDRIKIYINGEREINFSTSTFPTFNRASTINAVDQPHQLGASGCTYLANVCFIDGGSLDPASFGSKSTFYNEWRTLPQAALASLCSSYGTTSFFLDFNKAASVAQLGYDASTHNNNFTVANYVLTGRTPNWMPWGPAKPHLTWSTNGTGAAGLSNGNLTYTGGAAVNRQVILPIPLPFRFSESAAPEALPWYVEAYVVSNAGAYVGFTSFNPSSYPGSASDSYGWNLSDGNIYKNGVVYHALGFSVSAGSTLMLACTGSSYWIGKNGSWRGGYVPGNSSGELPLTYLVGTLINQFFVVGSTSTAQLDFNFGQRPFSYPLPTGYSGTTIAFTSLLDVPRNSSNITNPADHFDVITSTGADIKALADARYDGNCIEWIKSRSNTDEWQVMDSSRGLDLSDPFTQNVVEKGYVTPTGPAIAYVFNTGSVAADNTVGTQTSVVSANTEAGIASATYRSLSNSTFGTGLLDYPRAEAHTIFLADLRNFSATGYNWVFGPGGNGLSYYYGGGLRGLHPGTSEATSGPGTGAVSPVSGSIVSRYTLSDSADETKYLDKNGIAHFFTIKWGFLTTLNYRGNGLADGPFVYLGFKPKMVWVRLVYGSPGSWAITDSVRNPYNVASTHSCTDTSVSEAVGTSSTGLLISILANGFKINTSSSLVNASGQYYVCFAVADVAETYALAR